MIAAKDGLSCRLSGQVSLSLGESADNVRTIMTENNLVVQSASEILVGMLSLDLANFTPSYIVLGSGGDLEQGTLVDAGARVAPLITDTQVRQVIARLPIITVEKSEEAPNRWTYVAIARPFEAITGSLNELGLESANGTLLSHFVTDVSANGKSKKYIKSAREYLVVRWAYELNLEI